MDRALVGGGGAEWTLGYGGPDVAWECAVYPRIRAFLPAAHILEIGPGLGLWTSYLRRFCKRMTLVDLVPTCIDGCRKKFGRWGMTYHVNDGRSLAAVKDGSVDLVFSWHSLVHCQHEVMRAYVGQLARKLRPGGVGLLQHSNYGAYLDPVSGRHTQPNVGGFGEDMTGELFAGDCQNCGLEVVLQEVIQWAGPNLVVCNSLFRRPLPGQAVRPAPPPVTNLKFWETAREQARVLRAFGYPSRPLVIR